MPGFPGTSLEAQNRLKVFITESIRHYHSQRDRLDLDGTSRLSPYLRFELLSAREAFIQAQIATFQTGKDEEQIDIQTWKDELVWREFYIAILYHFPQVMNAPFREY